MFLPRVPQFCNAIVTYLPSTYRGRCKSWTLDSGLDRGLDHGLDRGLDRGLEYGLEYGLKHGLNLIMRMATA